MSSILDRKIPTDRPAKQPPTGIGRKVQVKNKAPAPVQITAEQLLREAEEHKLVLFKAPKQIIQDEDELDDYRLRKRKEFEDALRRQRQNIGVWVRYGQWEAQQHQFDRARSIFERALDVDGRNQTLWLKYTEMEMENRFVNHARNVWDRAVTVLPRVDQFWYKYAHMEEMLGKIANSRQIFERWMQWSPDLNAWSAYINFEVRHKAIDRAREVFERLLVCHPEVKTYLKYAKFEVKQGAPSRARLILERCGEELAEESHTEEYFIAFAQFEQEQKEMERARSIYKFALDHLPKTRAEKLYHTYVAFEKQFGNREAVENVILSKRRFQYEEELKENPRNYDVWFDYTRLEETSGDIPRIREVYERAIAQIPPVVEKQYWKRYIYLWIKFALFEEVDAKDTKRAREVYAKLLELIPHKVFTFSKIWINAAMVEVRDKKLDSARKLLGTAIGKCPREKVFKAYIDLEMKLGNIDRCRTLYEKYLEFMPENCYAWSKFAELESSLNELERSRAIFEMAVAQPILDMPEVVWKAYIDLEINQGVENRDRVRYLYKRLLQRTKHVKVWVSRAQFEASSKETEKAREVFEEADEYFKAQEQLREERAALLESYRDFEKVYGDAETLKKVEARLPRRMKKKRQIVTEDGTEGGWEEYWHYVFPDEESQPSALKLLERARAWKKAKIGDDPAAQAAAAAAAAAPAPAPIPRRPAPPPAAPASPPGSPATPPSE